jgi:simple sugar transport system ATP-binding protein
MHASEPFLQMQGITKTFPGVRALSGVDFFVRRGEIHALMGENGAGKSTLIKVLTGVYPRDAGEILLAGRPIHPRSVAGAEALGISTVYQEVNLIPHLSVAENICLGRQPTRFGKIRWKAVSARARQALERLEVAIDVSQELSSHSIAVQQMVAIARALDTSASLLILDEPTSSLDETETEELFAVMRRLRGQGLGIIFITHFLDQVYEVADRITVLRNGERVGQFETARLPRIGLIAKMIGREPEAPAAPAGAAAKSAPEEREAFLDARGLGRKGGVEPMDLAVGRGEVVGLAGLLGSGRTEVARLLFGIDKADSGEIWIEGKKTILASPRRAIEKGLAFCSEDRKTEGLIPDLSVRENIILAMQASRGPLRRLPMGRQVQMAEHYIRALDIKTPSPEQTVGNLSGGNQQKVLLARWLAMQPRLIILDEPTRGIDVGAKAEIEKLVARLAAEGMAILFISAELEEVVRNSHRVVVLRDRAKVAELAGTEIDEQVIMHAIARHETEETPSGGTA